MKPSRVLSLLGLLSALVSLVFIPLLFGIIAVVSGWVAYKKGDTQLGLVIAILGLLLMLVGLYLGALTGIALNTSTVGRAMWGIV